MTFQERLRIRKLREQVNVRKKNSERIFQLGKDNPRFMIPAEIKMNYNDVDKTVRKRAINEILAKYMRQYAVENYDEHYLDLAERVDACGVYWNIDSYRLANVADVRSVNFCHNKFCQICQKQLQKARDGKMLPVISVISEKYDWYMLTLTVENVSGAFLKQTLEKMTRFFGYLMRLLLCRKKCAWYDFSILGCVAGLRNVEITFNPTDYHPHIHCMIALRQGLDFPKIHCNKFSYSKENGFTLFSDFEILIQKAWRLWYNGQKVSKETLRKIRLGYSCQMSKVEEENYRQVFKYCLKPDYDNFTYEQWIALNEATYHKRFFQGYGLLFGIKDDYDNADNPAYDLLIGQLRHLCGLPEKDMKLIGEIQLALLDGLKVISRKTVKPCLEIENEDSN